jgi:hypothetical protein
MVASLPNLQIDEQRPRPWRVIGMAGLVSGTLDITAAFVTWAPQGVPPVVILKGIASGLLGRSAFHGGAGTAALGGILHFLIAFTATAIFYAPSRRLDWMVRRPFLSGVSYGLAVYFFMNWIVLPLSRDIRPPFSLSRNVIAALTLVVCIGLPNSLIVRRFSIPPRDRS